MGPRTDPSALRWLIGAELGRYRREATMTLVELAGRTGIGKPKLGHMETGRYQQFPEDIATVLRACGADQQAIDRLTTLATRSDAKTWWAPWAAVMPDWFKTYVGLEGLADGAFVFESMVIPGLLQTEDYAQALTLGTGFVRPDHAERFVSFRQTRARRLTDDDPLVLHAVIGEAALRLRVNGDETRRAQLAHLITMSELPNVTVQVLRPEDGPHAAGAIGKFVLLDFVHVRPIAYTEVLDGAMYVQDPDGVRTYNMVADNLRQVALSPAESRALIRELAGAA
ncbi:transcriptional regulator [Micromonospora ureilytica]|uniref:Transcriptional regulator n=1 Tax=Micromonospora ureilytica TaxID=709868 RepID=A0A3N9XQT1_9ACTN|nr:helix-turn-helix transcriptional regulator [Micromonospora ureilytica]RQX15485.1 transcriptional regulator [Micromonospora ureilytica]WSG33504.1 helix-turn-helix domain-containing protein [Micromonospora ureilytica]